jgi:hypothetical protein
MKLKQLNYPGITCGAKRYQSINKIHNFSEAFVLANRARRAIRKETKLSNMRAWTYGITTIGASIFAIKVNHISPQK